MKMSDPISPDHYQFANGFQVIDLTENLNFCLGNVVKYVARAGRKSPNPLEDLMKARYYLNREIDRLEN
jgi:hypothetical protein